MGKKHKGKNQKRRNEQADVRLVTPQKVPGRPKLSRRVWGYWEARAWPWIAVILTVLGGWVSYVSILPHPTITQGSAPLDPDVPLTTEFTVGDSSPLAMRHVTVWYQTMDLRIGGGLIEGGGLMTHSNWSDVTITRDNPLTTDWMAVIGCAAPCPISYGKINIVVDYQPWIIPWPLRTSFHYETRPIGPNKMVWQARPDDD